MRKLYYTPIIFLHDYQDESVKEFINDMHYSDIQKKAVEYLSKWDAGAFDNCTTESAHGTDDDTEIIGNYLISWNSGLGYIGLERLDFIEE